MPKKNVEHLSQQFQDAVDREEIHVALKRVGALVNKLSGKDLELLRNQVRKIFQY